MSRHVVTSYYSFAQMLWTDYVRVKVVDFFNAKRGSLEVPIHLFGFINDVFSSFDY